MILEAITSMISKEDRNFYYGVVREDIIIQAARKLNNASPEESLIDALPAR